MEEKARFKKQLSQDSEVLSGEKDNIEAGYDNTGECENCREPEHRTPPFPSSCSMAFNLLTNVNMTEKRMPR